MESKFNFIILLTLVLLIVCLCLAFNYMKKNQEGFINYMNKYNNQPNINPLWVLNKEINPLVYSITLTILKDINNKLKQNYLFANFDNVIEDKDIEGNNRYVIDFFVYSINKEYVNDVNRKIIVDVTLLPGNNLQINTINFSNAIKHIDPMYINEEHDTLILKNSITDNNKNKISSIWKSTLENSKFDDPKTLQLNDINRGPWILPLEIQDKSTLRAFPCQDYGNWWDENAIPLTFEEENGLPKTKQPKWCYGSYNSATEPQYIVGQRYPQWKKQPSDRHKYDWMFDRRVGISGFPHGGSRGSSF
jgi:hypothetical protein